MVLIQGANESVDDFAQELRKLHSKAYSVATSGNPEAEKVGQIVLVNQFLSGLRSELQVKVVGTEGGMDEMVARAQFEETKLKELSTWSSGPLARKVFPLRGPATGSLGRPSQAQINPSSSSPSPQTAPAEHKEQRGKKPGVGRCYRCGLEGHMMRNCPYRQQKGDETESRGRRQVSTMTTQEQPSLNAPRKKIEELREKL